MSLWGNFVKYIKEERERQRYKPEEEQVDYTVYDADINLLYPHEIKPIIQESGFALWHTAEDTWMMISVITGASTNFAASLMNMPKSVSIMDTDNPVVYSPSMLEDTVTYCLEQMHTLSEESHATMKAIDIVPVKEGKPNFMESFPITEFYRGFVQAVCA